MCSGPNRAQVAGSVRPFNVRPLPRILAGFWMSLGLRVSGIASRFPGGHRALTRNPWWLSTRWLPSIKAARVLWRDHAHAGARRFDSHDVLGIVDGFDHRLRERRRLNQHDAAIGRSLNDVATHVALQVVSHSNADRLRP